MSKKEEPIVDEKVEGLKVKKKPGRPRKLNKQEETTKIDLTKKEEPKKEEPKKEENAIPESSTEKSVLREERPEVGLQEVGSGVPESNKDDNKQEEKKEETPIISEIVEEKTEKVETKQPEPVVNQLPENVNKLVSFMKETGGSLEDYVRLNADYSSISEDALLKEYYKKTKPHLDDEEINFVLEDNFYFDDEVEDERTVKKKQLARKEEIAKAKSFLQEVKDKYYDEIKLKKRNENPEMSKAVDFFNRYNKEQEVNKLKAEDFRKRTSDHFSEEKFKGFDFDLGDKKFKYGVNNAEGLGSEQGDLNNFLRKFLDEKGQISNLKDYHKALYTASNADTIAKHFYDQGVADGTKNLIAKSKNIDNSPRPSGGGDVFINGFKVKAISGVDSSKLKIKRKLNN